MSDSLRVRALAVRVAVAWVLAGVASAQQAPAGADAAAYTPHDVPQPPFIHLNAGPETLNPGDWPQHWPYIDEYDAVVAAAEVHHLRYTDAHVELVEVAYFPGVKGQMHGHPYPSVFANDAPTPHGFNVSLDPERKPEAEFGKAPVGMSWPSCSTMGPQAPHAETNQDTWPHHFYRLQYVRFDGADFAQHWREWYPRMTDPAAATPKSAGGEDKLSAQWPYAASADTWRAAPNTYRLLFEDDHIRLLEVTVRPGEKQAMAGDPYPSVLAFDAGTGEPMPQDMFQDQGSALNGQGSVHVDGLANFPTLSCTSSPPRAPHALRNTGKVPVHYYQIDFKRIDGEGLRTHWREWYPWMGRLTDSYAANPYSSNYH